MSATDANIIENKVRHTEVNQDIVQALGHVLQESSSNLVVGRVLREVDGDEQLLSLSIDITDVDTTLVCEENPVAL